MKYHIINKSEGDFPLIGNTNKSQTSMPAAYKNYIDSAGFLDTKGPKQEILNSYATAQLFKQGAKVKIVVVIEQSSLISSRGNTIVDVANTLHKLFPDEFHILVESIILVISKVTEDIKISDIRE